MKIKDSFMLKLFCFLIIVILPMNCAQVERDNPNDPKSDLFTIEIKPSIGSGKTITGHESLVISFSDPMDTGSLDLGGDMGAAMEAGNISWNSADDELTIDPNPDVGPLNLWPSGNSRKLNIDCDSSMGPGISESFSYNVEYVVYVGSSANVTNPGDPANAGTKGSPLSVVQDGIDLADDLYTTADVRVAVGTYQSDYRGSTPDTPVIDMAEGISIYGGYSSDFSNRDVETYETIFQDTSSSEGTNPDPNRAVNIDDSITQTTTLDGFTIISGGAGSAHNASIFNLGSPKISNNKIEGLGGGYGGYTYGIIVAGGTPVIEKNHFSSLNGGINAYGVYTDSSINPMIINNIILPGSSVGRTYGIWESNGSDSEIYNNIIDCGSGAHATDGGHSIYISESNPKISNNIFINQYSNGTVKVIQEDTDNSNPSEVRNNNFYGVFSNNSVYVDFTDGALATILNMETDLTGESITNGGNISFDPQFSSSGDGFHLSSSSNALIRTGGLDGGSLGLDWGFNDDKDANTRTGNNTTGWSMGPYEYGN